MYEYTMSEDGNKFEVTGKNFKAVYNGDEDKAIEVVGKLNENVLNEAKRKKIIRLHKTFQAKIDSLKSNVPEYEVETWSTQSDEWTAYTRDNTTPTPVCDALALARGIDREVLLEKIGVKVNGMFTLLGTQQQLEDVIASLTTVEEIDALEIPFSNLVDRLH